MAYVYLLVAAYVSWVCYLLAGLIALLTLQIIQPYGMFATLLLAPVIAMFVYMHINRSKLYPYQLMMVPLYVACMLLITIGATDF
jgi:4-amino-4-deoxy-L-arabinose transferase-like glycosyltransferase